MSPLQLEQMMMSSFSTNSIAYTTDSFSANTHIRSDRFVWSKSHQLRKKNDVPVLHTDGDVRGTSKHRFPSKMAVGKLGIFFRD
jgi:hypothetical protein